MKLLAALLAFSPAAAQLAPLRPPVVLNSPRLEVSLDTGSGLPIEYRLRGAQSAAQSIIGGAGEGHAIIATVFRAEPRGIEKIEVRPRTVIATPTRADFEFHAPQFEFTLRYELQGPAVFVSLENVKEPAGFQLIDVATPALASVHEEDGGAWLAHGEDGGHLIRLSEAKPGRLPLNRFWGGVAVTLPVVMIGTSKALCVEEVMAYMDTTDLAVEGDPGHRTAALGTSSVYRVDGTHAWDMNANPGKPKVAGNARTPNLPVGQRPLARLDFAGDFDGNGVVDWLDGAKIVRARMPPIPTHYYDNRLPYMIHVDEPRWPEPHMSFEQTGKLIRQVAMLTGNAPQDVYLWGWQFQGKDTGYPAVNVVNGRAGGYEGLEKLMADARQVNANVSMSDNYDDAYRSSPAWDTAFVARQPDGEIWESRAWTGETSYILGLAKYMAGPGADRVKYTCQRYGVRDTYLVDVLSYYPIRNDWDPAHPASGFVNLTEGRYRVLDEFKKCGLDIVSEQLRYAFIGRNTVNGNGPTGGDSPFGGEPIPLAATIYRKSAIWGLSGQQWKKAPEIYTLFYNGHEFFGGGAETPEHFANFYYGVMVPWYQVHYRDVESYQRDGDLTVIGLAGHSGIDIDWKDYRYTVTVDGVEVASNGDTFCPVGNDRIAFYSKADRRLTAPIPAGWDPAAAVALELSTDKAVETKLGIANGKFEVEVRAKTPILVFRDGAGARRRMRSGGS